MCVFQLTSVTLEAEKVESELREELSKCVSKESHNASERKVSQLEAVEAKLRVELSKVREMVEVANLQVRSIVQQRDANERELNEMRELVKDLQKDSDGNKALGKLHHDKVNLQVGDNWCMKWIEGFISSI